MPSHRSLRMAEAIREVVSQAILFQVSDPRVQGVTVLHAEVTGDLRNATVFVSIMGTPAEQETAMRGLRSATGFLQSLVAARLQTRSTPVLAFKKDEGIKKSVEMSRLIEETLAADRRARGEEEEAGPAEGEGEDDETP
nr:ribosome-binding factor A [uncultured bacterium]